MGDGISLIIFKSEEGVDVSQLVETIKWGGRKGSAARSLTATLIDDDGYKHARSEIDVEKGYQCIFCEDGDELFRGLIVSQTQSDRKRLQFTAYDNGIYLANNKDTYTYENKTADQVFTDCCTRLNIPIGEVSACSYKIPQLTKSKTTAFDAISDALSLDFDATGIRHYVMSSKGKLSLLTRRENILQWVIEVGQNLSTYTYSRSIENIKTRVKLVSKEGTVLAEKRDAALEKKIGIFQEIEQPDESLTEAQVNDLVNSILNEKSTPERTLTISAIGNSNIISGLGVFIIIPELGISRTFYVDSDTHIFQDNKHTMTLKLTYANDIAKESGAANETGHKVGDVVQFHGGYQYVSSTASTPTGSKCAAGPARITLYAKGAKHPWHLIHEDSSSRVYGWVDEGSFS